MNSCLSRLLKYLMILSGFSLISGIIILAVQHSASVFLCAWLILLMCGTPSAVYLLASIIEFIISKYISDHESFRKFLYWLLPIPTFLTLAGVPWLCIDAGELVSNTIYYSLLCVIINAWLVAIGIVVHAMDRSIGIIFLTINLPIYGVFVPLSQLIITGYPFPVIISLIAILLFITSVAILRNIRYRKEKNIVDCNMLVYNNIVENTAYEGYYVQRDLGDVAF